MLSRRRVIASMVALPLLSSCVTPNVQDNAASGKSGEENKIKYVLFEGEVNGDSCAALTLELSNYINSGFTDIRVLFSSGGGNLASALQVYDFIKSLPDTIKITTANASQVNSAAVILYLAGKKRIATNNSLFVLHYPFTKLEGNNKEWRNEYMDAAFEQGVNVYKANTTMSEKQLGKLKQYKGLILSAEEARALGIVQEIVAYVGFPVGGNLTTIHNNG